MPRNNGLPTQKEEVLWFLMEYGSITAMEGFKDLYIIDLAGCIRDLRKEYVIDDEWVNHTNKYGRPIQYKRYIFVGKKADVYGKQLALL